MNLRIRLKRALGKGMRRLYSFPIYLVKSTHQLVFSKKLDNYSGISIVAIAKNESSYIREWVKFHKKVGINKIYLYDNGSTDHMKAKIDDFIAEGYVEYVFYPGIDKQYAAYNDAIKKHKYETKYMAFIDVDEFLMPSDRASDLFKIVDDIIGVDFFRGGVLLIGECMDHLVLWTSRKAV